MGVHRKLRHDDPRKVLSYEYGESHPDCFNSSKQYRDYVWLMRGASEPKDTGVCLDCSPEYKARMMAEGRCEHPETKFVIWRGITGEYEQIGISDKSKYWKKMFKHVNILSEEELNGEDKQ